MTSPTTLRGTTRGESVRSMISESPHSELLVGPLSPRKSTRLARAAGHVSGIWSVRSDAAGGTVDGRGISGGVTSGGGGGIERADDALNCEGVCRIELGVTNGVDPEAVGIGGGVTSGSGIEQADDALDCEEVCCIELGVTNSVDPEAVGNAGPWGVDLFFDDKPQMADAALQTLVTCIVTA